MFDNFLFNLKSKLNIQQPPAYDHCNDDPYLDTGENRFATQNFFVNILNRNRNYMSIKQNCDDKHNSTKLNMLPRVVGENLNNKRMWDPVELAPKQKTVEHLDNVLDKFVRIIHISEVTKFLLHCCRIVDIFCFMVPF